MASGGPGDPGSWNRYAYANGDPVNLFDSLGLEGEVPQPTINPIYDGGLIDIGYSGVGCPSVIFAIASNIPYSCPPKFDPPPDYIVPVIYKPKAYFLVVTQDC